MRLAGKASNILPVQAMQDIAGGGDQAVFAKSEHATLVGWSFCDIRLHLDNTHNGFAARGVHG